jgi:hypothetical protein
VITLLRLGQKRTESTIVRSYSSHLPLQKTPQMVSRQCNCRHETGTENIGADGRIDQVRSRYEISVSEKCIPSCNGAFTARVARSRMISPFESRAIMKGGFFICSLALVCLCMWTLDLFAAASPSLGPHASAPPRRILTVSRYGVSIEPTVQGSEFSQREFSVLNLLGIRYAKGHGVKRNPRIAMRFFLLSALNGYTPAMANVGFLYEIGATGRPNQHRAYAWVRTALAFGVPEQDHDTTVLKLGMIFARLGSDNVGAAERLAGAIATRIVDTSQCSPGQETELVSNGSL